MARFGRGHFWVAGLALAGLPGVAQASLPVPYAVVGCISKGAFTSSGFTGEGLVDPALTALEGRTVRVEGSLAPGDRFQAKAVFVVDQQCRRDLFKRYFLCAPCATLPGMPDKMLPPQPGRKVNLPPAAVREFDNLGRWMRQ
jgi:hypothetical protein